MNVSSVKNLNGEVFSAVQDASLTNVVQSNSGNWQDITAYQNASATYLKEVSIPESATWNEVSTTVQTNSAQWAEGGAISSYTMTLSPYGRSVINTLNETFISAFLSQSADESNFANSANSANYAETVNETYLENKGFARNLTSEYGTVSIVNNNIIESTNSAIVRTTVNEGFVSAFEGKTIGPNENGIATYIWDKSLPNTTINLNFPTSQGETLTYSANTDLTGEIVLPTGYNIIQTINIPNATEFKVSSNNWTYIYSPTVSAADQFETTVGELAWASALPIYEYDNTNKISAINGSALAGGSDFDPTYMSAQIDNKLNNTEVGFRKVNSIDYVSGISGKDISAKFAGRATTALNCDHANTASYDDNGNSLTITYYNAQEANNKANDLFNFVQSNSASWGGGSSPAGGSVLFHYNYSYDPNGSQSINSYISGANDLYFEASYELHQGYPSDIVITRYGNEIGRITLSQVSSDDYYNYFTAFYNNVDGGEIGLQNNGTEYTCYVSANGVKTNAFNQGTYHTTTNNSVKFNIQGYNITGTIIGLHNGNGTPLTSFTGSLTDFTANGYDQYETDIYTNDDQQQYYYDITADIGEGGEGGSSVASGDVFPPTNNLEPQTTYYLGWNANNGGLFWYHP